MNPGQRPFLKQQSGDGTTLVGLCHLSPALDSRVGEITPRHVAGRLDGKTLEVTVVEKAISNVGYSWGQS